MSLKVLKIEEFNEKIKQYIPFHEVSIPPRLGDIEGQKFKCGCGKDHTMDFDKHYFIADGGMFKAIILSPNCGYLNALKLKKLFSSGIENLFCTKFLLKKPKYGLNDYPDIPSAIDIYLKRQ